MKYSRLFVLSLNFCILFFMMHATVATGDTLLMRNGDQMIGQIIAITDQTITVDVNGLAVTVNRADVLEIIRKEPSQENLPPAISPVPVQATPDIQIPVTTETQSVIPLLPNPTQETPAVENAVPMPLLPVVLPPGKAYQVTGVVGRFRKGPSLDHEIIDSLPGMTLLIEIETVDNWLHAKTVTGVEGWIHPSSVRPLENLPCLVIGDRLHVREAADDLSRSLERLRLGDVIIKLEEQRNEPREWWYVLCNNSLAGWCNKKYLQPMVDTTLYQPLMRVVGNAEMGSPIQVDLKPIDATLQQITFVLANETLEMSGKTKLLVFFRDPALFMSPASSPAGESILNRERLENALSILKVGLPEDVAVNYVGADLLTLLGERVQAGWQYSLVLPASPLISFGFVVQEGPNRGTLILIQ